MKPAVRSAAWMMCVLTPLVARAAESGAEAAAVRAVVQSYVEAREARDPGAIAALFTEDADQLTSSGEWRRGREALVRGAQASSARTDGKRTITVESVRFLSPDVALADGRYEIVGGSTERKMWASITLTRGAAGWRIAAIRNMLPAAPPAPLAAPR